MFLRRKLLQTLAGLFTSRIARAFPHGGGSAVIVGNDLSSESILKRNGTSASVPVSGTYSGFATAIQAQVVEFYTPSTVVVAWTTVVSSPSAGVFSASLTVPQGGWYLLMIRMLGPVPSTWTGANKWAVGELILMLGQSNLSYFAIAGGDYWNSSDLTRVTPDGINWSRVGWYNPGYPVGASLDPFGNEILPGSIGAGDPDGFVENLAGGDAITLYANAIQELLGIPVGIGLQAVGGSPITEFCTLTGCTTLVSNLLTNMGGAVTCIYHQGESESAGGIGDMTAAEIIAYIKPYLSGLLTGLKAIYPSITLGQTICGPSELYSSNPWSMGAVRQAKLEWANSNSGNGGYVAASIFDAQLIGGNGPHYGSGHIECRWAQSTFWQLGAATYGGQGPRINASAASRSGAVITLPVTQNGGTALADGNGGDGASPGLLGFTVIDSTGAALTIASTLIVGNSVQLTLSAVPTNLPIGVDLGISLNDPYGVETAPGSDIWNFNQGNVVYDNFIPQGDTIGIALLCTDGTISLS